MDESLKNFTQEGKYGNGSVINHNNISQIYYCGKILLQSSAVFLTFWHFWE